MQSCKLNIYLCKDVYKKDENQFFLFISSEEAVLIIIIYGTYDFVNLKTIY